MVTRCERGGLWEDRRRLYCSKVTPLILFTNVEIKGLDAANHVEAIRTRST
jgi:hypothetical protein